MSGPFRATAHTTGNFTHQALNRPAGLATRPPACHDVGEVRGGRPAISTGWGRPGGPPAATPWTGPGPLPDRTRAAPRQDQCLRPGTDQSRGRTDEYRQYRYSLPLGPSKTGTTGWLEIPGKNRRHAVMAWTAPVSRTPCWPTAPPSPSGPPTPGDYEAVRQFPTPADLPRIASISLLFHEPAGRGAGGPPGVPPRRGHPLAPAPVRVTKCCFACARFELNGTPARRRSPSRSRLDAWPCVATLLLEHLCSGRNGACRVFTAMYYPAGEHGHALGVRGRLA